MLTRGLCVALLFAVAVCSAVLAWAKLTHVAQPETVLRILPWYPDALLERAETARAAGAPSAEIGRSGRQILRMAPLLEAPLVFVGLDRADNGDRDAATKLFLAAAHRQPRNIPALSWLATEAMREADYDRAAQLLEQLHRVDPRNGASYADAFSSLLAHPRGSEVYFEALGRGSALAMASAEKLVGVSDDLAFLMRAAGSAPVFRQRVVERVARDRGLEIAFIAWLSFLSSVEAEGLSWPFDPAFVGSDAPTPFNWRINDDAERLKEGGLSVRYAGRGKATFVEQTILLGPGRYRFSAEMDGEMSASGGGFVWRVRCLPGDVEIGSVRVEDLARTLSTKRFDFAVPATDCRVQTVSLDGAAGALTTRARATVRRVAIRPASAGVP